jgi:hypothetical protein
LIQGKIDAAGVLLVVVPLFVAGMRALMFTTDVERGGRVLRVDA